MYKFFFDVEIGAATIFSIFPFLDYRSHALDTEKQEIVNCVFSELIFKDRKLFHHKAKKGFDALLNCHFVSSGSGDYLFTELFGIYQKIIKGMTALNGMPLLTIPAHA